MPLSGGGPRGPRLREGSPAIGSWRQRRRMVIAGTQEVRAWASATEGTLLQGGAPSRSGAASRLGAGLLQHLRIAIIWTGLLIEAMGEWLDWGREPPGNYR